MSQMSGIEISSSQGLKKPPKMSPREVSFFFPRAYFKVFYNPRDEEISIPHINGHSENLFLFEFKYVQKMKRYRNLSMAMACIDSYRNTNFYYFLNLRGP